MAGVILYLAMLMVFGNLENLSETFSSQEALFLVLLAYVNHEWAILMLAGNRSREAVVSGTIPEKLVYFIIAVLVTALVTSGIILAYFMLILGYRHFLTELVTINILMIVFQVLVQLYYAGMGNIQRTLELSMEQEELQTRQLELELDSFRTEMNPDLLMECLEKLLTLMRVDIQESERYIQALSNQYRYLLDNRQKDFVGLEEEVLAARDLVYLLNGGSEPRLILAQEGEGIQADLVPGTLASILCNVENSMILSCLDPMEVRLVMNHEGDLVVRHAHKPRIFGGTLVRMERLNRSYEHYTGRKLERRENGSWLEWIVPRIPEIITEDETP